MSSIKIILFLNVLIFSFGCAPTRYVKPLEKGEHSVNTHFGGPITKVPGGEHETTPFVMGYQTYIDRIAAFIAQ